jgi:lipopolysaccharide/colanic/teichoic acid biosynthesis glycosyltransferase
MTHPAEDAAKRAVDLALATIGLMVAAPGLALIAVLYGRGVPAR